MLDLAKLTTADFEPLLHENFRLVDGENATPLELVEVEQTRAARSRETRAPFLLQFKSPPGPVRSQGIFRIEHEQLGAMEVFAVPAARDETGCYYDVIFS